MYIRTAGDYSVTLKFVKLKFHFIGIKAKEFVFLVKDAQSVSFYPYNRSQIL